MGLIERWECPNDCGTEPQTAAAPEGVERWRCYRCGVEAVKVEYVPRTEHSGAVDALREAAAEVERLRGVLAIIGATARSEAAAP